MLSLLQMHARLSIFFLATAICPAQVVKLPDEPVFGVTVVGSSGLKGDIYLLEEGTEFLPNFKKLKPIGSVYTQGLNIQPRNFREGFPGITGRFEWFAIDYNGRFWISKPGEYGFALCSDDGGKLYIDGKMIVDNDGIHPPIAIAGTAKLAEGVHGIRVSFFQGPRYQVALILAVSEPGQDRWYIFNTNNYRPPADKFKDGNFDEAAGAKTGKKSKKKPK